MWSIKIDWRKFFNSYMWFGFYSGGAGLYSWKMKNGLLVKISNWQTSNRLWDRITPMRKYGYN